MAYRKEQNDTPDLITDDLKSGHFKRFYLLTGDETYLRDMAAGRLKKALMPEMPEMNYVSFDGRFTKGKELTEALIQAGDTLPFFADKRLIFVNASGFFKKANEEFTEYIKNAPETTAFIFTENEVDKRLGLSKFFAKEGRIAEYERSAENLKIPILTILKKNNKQIRPSTYERLIEKTGIDMEFISHELEKLIAYTGDRTEITMQDVEYVVSDRTEEDSFALANAMSERDGRKALDAYYDMIRLGSNMIGVITMLYHQFNVLLMIKGMLKKGMNNEAMGKKLGYKPFAVGKRVAAASHYTEREIKSFINECAETRENITKGLADPNLSVEKLIIKYSSGLKTSL